MNNWLDKYEQGGMVLKQKTKDNYGKKANPNNPDVSLPPGFKGLAYNTKGRNYSPAWGGQFQMGGSLPGAVGFTYARTAGAAPSNGPYAKKTKASAQKGIAVSDNTRTKPVIVDKPMNRESVRSTEKQSYRMSPQEALLNKLKGVKLKESQDRLDKTAEKITAVGSLSPNPFISVPSAIGNFALGASELDLLGLFGSTPSSLNKFKKVGRRAPFFKAIGVADALSDIFEFTPSEDLPKKQNGGEMKFYQEGLDWKPRNISRNGSEIPQAQLGLHMLTPDYNQVGENIMEMLSVPQKALTKLISGKYQTPSEAMGIKNKAGAIATDILLDPLNLMGAGAVAKASTETGALSKAYKYNPWAFKPNPEAYYRQVGKDAIDDALSTKLIRERGEVVSPENFENFNQQITDLHGQGDYVDYYEKMKAQTLAKEHGPMPYFMKGELFFDDKSVMKGGAKSKGIFQGKKTKADHLIESNHPSEAFQNSFAYKFSPGNVEEVGGIGVLKPNPNLRDIENFNLYKQHWLQGYKKVKPPKKKEEGGEITKDDNGYWNPDNWGEPVEIGSNEITMQGVYEPLLGISDTGDTQMMYPGEDYTFDGESVTEYPIKKNGGWLEKWK